MNTQEIKDAINQLNLDQPAAKWLENMLSDVSREILAGRAGIATGHVLLGRKWPLDNLTGRQRDAIADLLDGLNTREQVNNAVLLLRHPA